jgi:hypothetical protein
LSFPALVVPLAFKEFYPQFEGFVLASTCSLFDIHTDPVQRLSSADDGFPLKMFTTPTNLIPLFTLISLFLVFSRRTSSRFTQRKFTTRET